MASRFLLLATCSPSPLAATLEFGDAFLGQGTVIQRGVTTQVWGTSSEKEVSLFIDGDRVAQAAVDAGSRWAVQLPAQAAGFNRTLRITDATAAKEQSVSFGEVLMCAGQSNMDMTVAWEDFRADNGTAELADAGRYTGGISLKSVQGRGNLDANSTLHWFEVTSETLPSYSALCWYTGRALYEYHNRQVPIGLIEGENGGTPIEKFITKQSVSTCHATHDAKTCGGQPDEHFYDSIVGTLTPYTVGAILWDQAEADVTPKCNHVDVYPCLERELVQTWRVALGGHAPPFVAVQLPGYTGGVAASSSVFEMRLAQELGLDNLQDVALLPTYDLSCPHCPKGSVHNTDKQDVGARAAQQLRRMLYSDRQPDGPRANWATALKVAEDAYEVTVDFAVFELAEHELAFVPTRNCTECCGSPGSDFDVSVDGSVWVNGTAAKINPATATSSLTFTANLAAAPTMVRYTASVDFPQCAIYQAGLPAFPFKMAINETAEAKLFV
eukprot:TRINITY_DN57373_c0_g1_i1.p1 TRINITY_DN57373_c0_g1~~TRINITY_DN57373_c0_g1_i1.p1  ORF type:complete len:510 (-),score=74.90 TRINITY_DN57373_c0_g1_i1:60-1553(-)